MLLNDDVPGLALAVRSEEFEAKVSICKEEGEGETINMCLFLHGSFFHLVIYNVTLRHVGTCEMIIIPLLWQGGKSVEGI